MDKTPELAETKGAKKRGWRIVRRLIRSAFIIYVLVCVAMFFLQTKLIFPGASTQGTRDARIIPGPGEELVDLKASNGVMIKGLFCVAQGGRGGGAGEAQVGRGGGAGGAQTRESRGVEGMNGGGNELSARGVEEGKRGLNGGATKEAGGGGSEGGERVGGNGGNGIEEVQRPVVFFFYGNAECMADCGEQVALFRDLGYHVMLVDYEGYGLSGGKPGEQGCYAAAEAAYQYVLTRADVDRKKLVAAGWSLGGGVAVDLVYKHRGDGTFAGLMTFCTFGSLGNVAQKAIPVLPVKLLLRHRFESAEKMKKLSLPWFAGHGHGDRVVAFEELGKLEAAYRGDAGNRTVFESGSDHNDFFDASPGLREAMAGWLERVMR